MFIRQYPKSGLKSWRTKKVQALDGKLFYTNDEYINHFTNIIIEITEKSIESIPPNPSATQELKLSVKL